MFTRRRWPGEPQQLGTFLGQCAAFAANTSGVFAVDAPLTLAAWSLLRCPSGVCTPEALPFAPELFAAGEASLGFTWETPASQTDISTCPVGGCASGPVLVKDDAGFVVFPGLFITPGPIDIAWPGTHPLSCPVTGCGTNPPAGTEWVTLWPKEDVTTDATAIHTHEAQRLTSCPLAGCPSGPRILASGLGDPRWATSLGVTPHVATDGTSLYFFDDGPGARWVDAPGVRLLKCPLTGCDCSGPQVLWTSPPWPLIGMTSEALALAVDATSVYFTARQPGGTSVLAKLPK